MPGQPDGADAVEAVAHHGEHAVGRRRQLVVMHCHVIFASTRRPENSTDNIHSDADCAKTIDKKIDVIVCWTQDAVAWRKGDRCYSDGD